MYFNPRSPHGERQHSPKAYQRVYIFQPTLPARGATQFNFYGQQAYQYISTHAPRTGSDGQQAYQYEKTIFISTHAPRTGSDVPVCNYLGKEVETFQPTLPARGATAGWRTPIHQRQ